MKNTILPGITRVSKGYKGILLDAYGVFWNGNACGVIPGAKDAMEALLQSGKIVGVLSNSTQLAKKEEDKLKNHGLVQGKHFHFFVTSGEVARLMFLHETVPLKTPRKTFWVFGAGHPKFSTHEAIFQGTRFTQVDNVRDADFIYIAIPHLEGVDQTDPEVFRKHVEALAKTKLPMVCPNPDLFAHEGSPPRAVVRQGSIAKMYEEMGGTVLYIGKPSSQGFKLAMQEFEKYGLNTQKDILMVGDTPETDIRGANFFGMLSALITQTGIMSERIAHAGLETALKALPAGDLPTHYIERFIDDRL